MMKPTFLLALSLTVAAAGCIPTGESAAPPAASAANAGKAAFDAHGCAQCHRLGEQGGRGGPDLTRAGSNPQHTAAWIAEHIRDPKSHNPASSMPGFQGKISDPELKALSEYLASLK
jgi:mono/diheme cytochrome c family protein